MKTTDFHLEQRENGWWVVIGEDEQPATEVEVSLWLNLVEAKTKQGITAASYFGAVATLVVLLIVCGTILGSIYLIWGAC